jgi:hypothetical protein
MLKQVIYGVQVIYGKSYTGHIRGQVIYVRSYTGSRLNI